MSEEMIKRKAGKKRKAAIAIISILVGVAIVGLFSLYALHYVGTLSEIMPYNSKTMSYQSADSSYLETAEGFSAGLAVGPGNQNYHDVSIGAKECGGLFSVSDGELLFAKNIYDKIYPASITKLMTAILAFKYGNNDDIITIMPEDLILETGSQVVGLNVGDQVRFGDLVTAMMVHSGNDAAQAIARVIGGNQSEFVKMMNAEAADLGATGTHFENPTGLHSENHYTTVYDIYLMLNESVKYEEFLNITQMGTYTLKYSDGAGNSIQKVLNSTDHYLTGENQAPKGVTVLGGKTGTTSIAGSCLSLFAQNSYGQLFISIVVRAQDKVSLYTDMNTLLGAI